ncbi:hypothetical protein [Dyella amyloliquefaciens]|uniref:hypothetical protein n=1 Tax=Dyella amyloliquefaciens TaxID=1770545 RepID=UPI00102EA548|nr:hypothetical protein [Dyella amyloliquefaciens]
MKTAQPALWVRSLSLPLLAAFAFVASGSTVGAQNAMSAQSLEGVWMVTRIVRTGTDAGTDTHPQPSIALLYKGYYSVIRDNSNGPRKQAPAPKDPEHPTDAEKIAKYDEWAPFIASGGTYEVEGNTVITHNVVAKQVKGMTQTEEVVVTFYGDSFVTGTPNDKLQVTYTRVR